MKVYSCPSEIPYTPDYKNYNWDNIQKQETEHRNKLKEWLTSQGFIGKNTGKIYSTPIADGSAQYMIGESSRKTILIHLPYGDAWQDRDVQHLPKKEILRRIEQSEKIAKLFEKK